jgi:NTP pyrophosphatase (non-canonical NTP hydrolase)
MGYTIWPDGPTGDVLSEVNRERHRQEDLRREGRFEFTCASAGRDNFQRLAILLEEVGEAARAALELGNLSHDKHSPDARKQLRKELVQIAAVAVAFVEGLDADVERK